MWMYFQRKTMVSCKKIKSSGFLNWKDNILIYIVNTFLCLKCTGKPTVNPLVKNNHQNLENSRISPMNKKMCTRHFAEIFLGHHFYDN